MKHFMVFILVLLLAKTINAQTTTYQTQFPYSTTNQPYSIYKAPDNSTFVFGDKVDACGNNYPCNHLIYVNHFSAEGKFLWTKDYRSSFSVSNPSAIVTKDGGFAFLGRLYDTTTQTWKGGLLIKCNRNGDIVTSRQLRSKKYTAFYPKGLVEDNDGNLLIFYDVANDMYYSPVLQIVKLNAKGDIIWNKTGTITNAFSNDIYEGVSMQQIGSRYYILGANNCQICEGVLTANIIVLDTSNKVLNCLNITADADYTSTYPTKILIKNNSTYLLGSYEYFPSSRNFLIPITDKPAQVTGISFSYNPFSLLYQVRNFSNIYPLVAGYGYFDKSRALIQMTPANFKETIMQYDSLGRICPSYKIPYVDTTTTQKVFDISKGNFVLIKDSVYLQNIAATVSADTLSATLICSGNAATEREAGTLFSTMHVPKVVSVYPNPAQNLIHISGLQQNADITILSSSAAIIQRVSITALYPVVSVSQLSTGIYFLREIENGRAPYMVSFVKH